MSYEHESTSTDEGDRLIPPQDMDAEAAVLSAVLTDPTAILKVYEWLRAEDFYSEAHRRIFEACLALHGAKANIDVVTVATWLKENGRISQVGGLPYMTSILDAAPAVRNIPQYARAVHELSRRREAVALTQRLSAEGYQNNGVETQDYLDSAVRRLERIARRIPGEQVETNLEVLSQIINSLRDQASDAGVKRGIPTGIATLDRVTGGLHPGQKTTVTAPTGHGKTTFALQIAMSVAKRGIGVAYFICEQTRAEALLKMLAAETRIPINRLRKRKVEEAEWPRVLEAAVAIGKLPIWFEQDVSPTISSIRHKARLRAESAMRIDRTPLGLIVLDHIHRTAPDTGLENRKYPEQLAHTTMMFKRLCQELEVAGLELAQMKDLTHSRDKKQSGPVRPDVNCIAWCKKISEEADDLIALHQPFPTKQPEHVEAIMLKLRVGTRQNFQLRFAGERFFEDGADVDDTIDPMIPTSRAWVDQGPPPPDDDYFGEP